MEEMLIGSVLNFEGASGIINIPYVQGLVLPVNPTDAANKAYVDSLTTNVRRLMGDFDASAGIVPVSTKAGETWVTTIAGIVDGVVFEVGDEIVARVDGATVIADFYTLQRNLDYATTAISGVVRLAESADVANNAAALTNTNEAITPALLAAYITNLNLAPTTASKGLTKVGNDIQLGGTLLDGQTAAITAATGIDTAFSVSLGGAGSTEAHGFSIRPVLDLSIYGYSNPSQNSFARTRFSTGEATIETRSASGVSGIYVTSANIGVGSTTPSFIGATYNANYAANFVARSLVDKGYVDTAIATATVTVSNGLTKTVNDITLGGLLLNNTTIGSLANGFGLTLQSTTVAVNADTNIALNVDAGTLTVGGQNNFAGAQYAVDYSTNYTDRSLVDKGYIDTKFAANRYTTTVNLAANTDFVITHNLNRAIVQVTTYTASGQSVALAPRLTGNPNTVIIRSTTARTGVQVVVM